jgi:hypothetical protein
VWLRKSGDGKVRTRVLADGHEMNTLETTSSSGWSLNRVGTSTLPGNRIRWRFEITVDKAHARHLGLAAEARNP